jgi:hypothetical protein
MPENIRRAELHATVFNAAVPRYCRASPVGQVRRVSDLSDTAAAGGATKQAGLHTEFTPLHPLCGLIGQKEEAKTPRRPVLDDSNANSPSNVNQMMTHTCEAPAEPKQQAKPRLGGSLALLPRYAYMETNWRKLPIAQRPVCFTGTTGDSVRGTIGPLDLRGTCCLPLPDTSEIPRVHP